MGQLVRGVWENTSTREIKSDGQFVRNPSAFRNWVTADGAAGPTGRGGFRAEPGRYHLYASYACPWTHRVLIYRSILGLEDAIDVSILHPVNLENGWEFADYPGATPDPIHGARYIYQVYAAADPTYTGKATVPVLWDRETETIVSNESADIMRMFGGAFRAFARTWQDFLPEDRRAEIDALNDRLYRTVNNGVYRTGFANSQQAYEDGVHALFETLEALEAGLGQSRFLLGERPLEPDWRLFTTLIRFNPVYYFHFKCNLHRLEHYPNLMRHTRDLLNWPGVRATVRLDHIVDHYYLAHRRINPNGIIPVGAHVDLDGPDWGPPEPGKETPC